MPVVTPSAKLMPKSLPQKRVMSFQTTLPVITYTLSMITSSQTMPSVSGTKRKWYMAVAANCRRERSTSCSEITASLLWGQSLHRAGPEHLRGGGVDEDFDPTGVMP